jgi:hypothetical protein
MAEDILRLFKADIARITLGGKAGRGLVEFVIYSYDYSIVHCHTGIEAAGINSYQHQIL